MNWFVRLGPIGLAYGPWESREAVEAWLIARGFKLEQEGAVFKVYETHDPSLYDAHAAMRADLD